MALISIRAAEVNKLQIRIIILLGTVRFAIGPLTDIEGASVNYNAPLILTKKGTHYELGTPKEIRDGKLYLVGDSNTSVLGFCPPQTEEEKRIVESTMSDTMLFLRRRSDVELEEGRFGSCNKQVEPNTLIRVKSYEYEGTLYSSGFQIYIKDGTHDLSRVERYKPDTSSELHDPNASKNSALDKTKEFFLWIITCCAPTNRDHNAWVEIFNICLNNNDQPIYASYRLHSFELFSTFIVQEKKLVYRHVLSQWKSNLDTFYKAQEEIGRNKNIDYLVPVQLVTYEDFIIKSWQRTTEDYRNTVPFYQINHNENRWNEIGKIVRDKMATKGCNFVDIFVGVHGELQKIEIPDYKSLSVPELVWKIVRCNVNEQNNESIAIVMRNTSSTAVKAHMIDMPGSSSKNEDFCSMHGWNEISKLSINEKMMGVYCSSVENVASEFKIKHLGMADDDILRVKFIGL